MSPARLPEHGQKATAGQSKPEAASSAGSGAIPRATVAHICRGAGSSTCRWAPFGFVFQLVRTSDNTLIWNFIAFGERHPDNPNTRTVYERAHKRLHGRYP